MTVETPGTAEVSPPHLEAWLSYLIDGQGYSASTAVSYRTALFDFCTRQKVEDPTTLTTLRPFDSYRDALLLHGYAKNTVAIRLNGLKSYYHFLTTRKHIDVNPVADLEVPNPKDFSDIPTFKLEEIQRMVTAETVALAKGRKEPLHFFGRRVSTSTLVEPRDAALIAMLYAQGLRAGEIALLERGDYDGKWLRIRGAKRAKKVQRMQIAPVVVSYMTVYLIELDRSPWALHPALFPPLYEKKDRSHRGLGMSADAVADVVQRRIERAGIKAGKRKLSPHVFRYSIATHLYECGYPMLEIKRHLRHASMETTLRYISQGAVGLPRFYTFHPHPWFKGRLFLLSTASSE